MAERVFSTLNDKCIPRLSAHYPNQTSTLNRMDRHPQHITSSLFSALPRLDPPRTYWNLNGELRNQYKDCIFPEIDPVLQQFFDYNPKGELVTIDAYMIGTSQKEANPTVLLIGGDSKTREGAKTALIKSNILAPYTNWRVDHTPAFPSLSNISNEPSVLDGFEFWSSNGSINWRDEGNSLGLAMDVYFNYNLYTEPSKSLPIRGLAIYINHDGNLRPATGNIIQLDNRIFLQTVYHAFHPGNYGKKRTELGVVHSDSPAVPSIQTLTVVGQLLVWSVDRDWALIEVSSEELESQMSHSLAENKETIRDFAKAGRPSSIESKAYTWTASSGMLKVVLSETTTYMKLPNSSSFEEVHKARLEEGSWSNGDSGAVVICPATGLTFGHILGGNRVTGVALILAADKVVEDFRKLDFSSRLHINASNADETQMHGVIGESTGVETISVTEASLSGPFSEHPSSQQIFEESFATNDSIFEPFQPSSLETKSKEFRKRTTPSPSKGGKEASGSRRFYRAHGLTDWPRNRYKGNAATSYSRREDQISNASANDEEDELYFNPLLLASAEGQEQTVKMVLDEGTDVNAQGEYYGNALQAASERGDKEMAMLLLDKGADVNAQGGLFGNALQAASERGDKEIAILLLDKGADVNAQGGRYGNALQAASARGHKEMAMLLLDKGADVNAQGGYYGNALQAASAGEHKDIVMLLRDKGAL